MPVPNLLRRLLVVPGAAALLTGALAVTGASAAHADPPEITMVEQCGVAALSWDTGTIGGDETWATTVLRNGVAIDRFAMRERGNRRYGATDRDVFIVRRAGLPDRDLVFNAPAGCADTPRLTVTAAAECHVLELRVVNEGTAAVTGLRLYSPASPTPEELAPIAPGAVTIVSRLADGDAYALISGAPGPEMVTWMAGTYEQPVGCGPDAVAVTLTDACDGVRVELTSRADGATRITVAVDGVSAADRVVAARARDAFTVPAEPGAVVVVRNAELALELARHTVRAVSCATPTPTPTPTPGGGTDPGEGPGGGSAGGGLPVTGAPAIALLVGSGALLAAGTVFLVVARRRRIRFSNPTAP